VPYTIPIRFTIEGRVKSVTLNSGEKRSYKIVDNNEGEVFKVVEEMPRFPGCEDLGLKPGDRENCSKEKMLQFIYENLKYPTEAKDTKVEGMVVVQFVVRKTGKVDNIKVVRDIGAKCGKGAAKAVEQMPDWIPGKQRGKTVDVLYTLPVKFRLQNDKEINEVEVTDPKTKEKVKRQYTVENQVNVTPISKDGTEDTFDELDGLDKMQVDHFKAFPNPVNDQLNLTFVPKEEGTITVKVFDISGKIVRTTLSQNHTGQFNKIFDLADVNSSVLYVTIEQNGKILTKKVAKMGNE